jgi:RND family efflux transporter MFP subunit
MKIKRWMGWSAAALVIAAAGGIFAASKMSGDKKNDEAAKKPDIALTLAAVDIVRAGPATLAQTLQISGTVDAATQAMVRSRHAGIATQMSKRAGDTVRQGELLARVDSDELRLRIGEREATIRQTQAALAVAESARAQQRSLSDRGFISKAALDSAESSYISAKSAHENALSQLNMARSALSETSLTAPISGVISKRSVEPGERISAEMNVFQIVDPKSLEVIVAIPAERAAELKIGQKATFQLDSTGGGASIPASLSRIVPTTASSARTVETRFTLPTESAVPAGAFLSGKVVLSTSQAPVTVPRSAVRADSSGNYVWLARDSRAQRVPVQLAANGDSTDVAVVTAGISAGVTVLNLRGAEPKEGQTLTMPAATVTGPDPASSTTSAATTAPAAASTTQASDAKSPKL